MSESKELYYDSVWLSEGSDCELCGWNPDNISIDEWEDGTWYINRELGCYHGFADFFDTLDEAVKRLEEFRDEQVELKKSDWYTDEERKAVAELDVMIERAKEHGKAQSIG